MIIYFLTVRVVCIKFELITVSNQLEETTNYEERRQIRARLRQVMADKEGKLFHSINCLSNTFRRLCVLILDLIY